MRTFTKVPHLHECQAFRKVPFGLLFLCVLNVLIAKSRTHIHGGRPIVQWTILQLIANGKTFAFIIGQLSDVFG